MNVVIDVNVAIVANGGRRVTAGQACELECIHALEKVILRDRIGIDTAGEILIAYGKLNPRGQPGVGDRFYRHLIDNQGNKSKVREYDTDNARAAKLRHAFVSGTLKKFDRSDRMYALCGVAANASILVATDSDWTEHEIGLVSCGVKILYVCGKAAAVKKPKPPKSMKKRA